MKKCFITSLILILASVFSSCASTGKTEKVKPVKIDFDAKLRSGFSKIDLDEDLAALKYIICSSYAGYEMAVEKGFDIDASIAEIKSEALKNLDHLGMIDTQKYQDKIFEVLNRDMKLNDMHFSVSGFGTSTNHVAKKLLFTNVYFEKTEEGFVVCQSDEDRVSLGAKFTGLEKNLYETFLGDKLVYRYAAMANPSSQRLTISLNGEQIPVSVLKPKKDEGFKYINNNASFIESDSCIYAGLQSFSMSDVNGYYMFQEMCKKISASDPEKTFILDLRQNGGGDVSLSCQLAASVFFNRETSEDHMSCYDFLRKEFFKVKIAVDSDILKIQKKIYEEQWKTYEERYGKNGYNRDRLITTENADKKEYFEKEAEQHKKVFILIDEGSASASEYAIGFLSLIPGVEITLLGNRTCGAVEYVGMHTYPLSKSGLRIYAGDLSGAPPCISQHENFHGEGEGFWPDYWVDNKNMLNTLIQLTGDKSLEEKLAGLEKSQL